MKLQLFVFVKNNISNTKICLHHCIGIALSSRYWHSHYNRAAPSEFVSSSIPWWQIWTAHAQPFSGARDLAFCLKVLLDSLLLWASSGGSGETARMRRLAWTFAARIGDKYQIRLTRSILHCGEAVWYMVRRGGVWSGVTHYMLSSNKYNPTIVV